MSGLDAWFDCPKCGNRAPIVTPDAPRPTSHDGATADPKACCAAHAPRPTSDKPPCLFPLEDGRRCLECATCQGYDPAPEPECPHCGEESMSMKWAWNYHEHVCFNGHLWRLY